MSTHSSLGLRVDGVMAQFTDASCWRTAAELELRAPWGLSDGSDLWEDRWMNDEPRFSQRNGPPLRPKLRVTVTNQRLISNNPTREEQMPRRARHLDEADEKASQPHEQVQISVGPA